MICPDVVGRGQSDWLADPMGYQIPQYAADMLALLAQVHQQAPITTLDWVGTSMGGLIGMGIAGQPGLPLPVPVRRLVLNDVGPVIQWEALQRIGLYLGQQANGLSRSSRRPTAMWAISTSFGRIHPSSGWSLSRAMVRALPESAGGGITLHYDPAIAVPFKTLTPGVRRGQVKPCCGSCTTTSRPAPCCCVVRSRTCSLAKPRRPWWQRGPRAHVVEFEGVGHAPTLVAADQVAVQSPFFLLSAEGVVAG